MKMLSAAVGGLGVIALLLALVEKGFGLNMMGISPGGFIRGATALYLLALVVMVYDRWYAGAASGPPGVAPKV